MEPYWHDNILRWRVPSSNQPGVEHVVDIAANGGLGECSCQHFQYRILPKLNEGNRVETSTRCKHILVARRSFTDLMIQTIAKKQPEA